MWVDLWNIMFIWFNVWLNWAKSVVDIVSLPFIDLARTILSVDEGTILDAILTLLFGMFGDMTLIEIMFGVGFPILLIILVVKFLVGLVQ